MFFTHGGRLVLLDVVEWGEENAAVVKEEVEDSGVDVKWSLSVVVSSVVSGVVSVAVIVV